MLGRIETRVRKLLRGLSRTHWLMRMLHLSVSEGSPNRPGLVLLQVDGLSLVQFRTAIAAGKLPFLKRLIEREHYDVHQQYSGLPSSTPAVQAELFYGVKGVVPAFSFLDRDQGKVVRMYEQAAAVAVESEVHEQLARDGIGSLCAGGSSYSNNFSGGADIDEAHFCASSLGWGSVLRAANPFALLFMIITNLNSVIRIVVLLIVELWLAIIDFFRGLYRGRNVVKELKFIPTRVAICVMLRELCVIGGKMDIQRGLPIVHINFLGYDEQSHRRGPDSRFAHWTLRGIDNAIERLWREATHAPRRQYEVWIYSDHGQSRTKSFSKRYGFDVLEAATAVYQGLDSSPPAKPGRPSRPSVQTQRARFLGARKSRHLFSVIDDDERPEEQDVKFVGLGPVGFVYFPTELEPAELASAARALAVKHNVPAAVFGRGEDQLRAWTEDGEFLLPQDVGKLVGDDHPFIDVIGEDLERLCRHPHAGDLTLLGWRKGVESTTFATENGSHAGLTVDETQAFSLLPKDAPLPAESRGYLRPCELREAALRHLGRAPPVAARPAANGPRKRRSQNQATESVPLRLMTYNVHSCVGIDGKLAAERIARVIARANPDVVALQELDVGRQRTDSIDQAELIARYLEMDYHFHPHIHVEDEKYGDAILTHLPMKVIKSGPLPGHVTSPRREPRGAIWVEIDVHGTAVGVLNTHLGLGPREQLAQVDALLGNHWLGGAGEQPLILCGDFNAGPRSRTYRRLCSQFLDAQAACQQHRPKCTFYSRLPRLRIDHVFLNRLVGVNGITVPRSELAKAASDHLPLIADLSIALNRSEQPAIDSVCQSQSAWLGAGRSPR